MTDNQKRVLEIYNSFADVCKTNNIDFVTTGGTVLGAVRHHGFIPWDDDIDVAICRDQFDYFMKNGRKWLPSYLKLYWSDRKQICRLVDSRAIVSPAKGLEGLFEDDQIPGLFIDIQPFDGVKGKCWLSRFLHSSRIFFWRSCMTMSEKEKVFMGNRPALEKIVIRAFLLFSFAIPSVKFSQEKFNSLVKKYSVEDSCYIADYVGRYFYKDIYPKQWWFPTIKMDFENIQIPVPCKYHEYLKQIYGDYMTIPNNKSAHFS